MAYEYVDHESMMEAVWSKVRKWEELDAWGLAQQSGATPLAADYFLQRKYEQGKAEKNGNWYGPSWSTLEDE